MKARTRSFSLSGRAPAVAVVFCFAVLGCVTSTAPLGDEPVYVVRRAKEPPRLEGRWDGRTWRKANTLEVTHFLPESTEGLPASDHRPVTKARVLYDDAGLYVHFRVKDRYVRSVATEYRGKVWEDACAEFFVQPKAGRGYFNFEINCGGTMLLSYHEDPAWQGQPLRKAGAVPWELAQQVQIVHTMPEVVDPEIADRVVWQLEYFIPFSLLEMYVGPVGDVGGQIWRANFYKIAETNSHPHFAAWSPVRDGVSFHQPRFFGILRLEP